MPTTQEAVTDNLYEFLQQWYTLFPQYQSNPFYPFGESYAGKFVPSITRRIHEENASENDVIKYAWIYLVQDFNNLDFEG